MMSEETSRQEQIGHIIEKYDENKRLISELRGEIEPMKERLFNFAYQFHHRSRDVTPNGEGYIKFDYGEKGRIHVDTLSHLREKLVAMREAQDEREHIEACMKTLGLQSFISSARNS